MKEGGLPQPYFEPPAPLNIQEEKREECFSLHIILFQEFQKREGYIVYCWGEKIYLKGV